MNINKEVLDFKSTTEQTIEVVKWKVENPIAILQIIHGMSEHIHRYDEFAQFMAQHNILCVGDTHAGHGQKASTLGFFCEKNGHEALVDDQHNIYKMMKEEYPDIPYFIFGHSMGSFILRYYISKYGKDLNGAIICGTGETPSAVLTMGKLIANIGIKIGKGKEANDILNSLSFKSFNNKIPNAKTNFDWLSRDDEEVKKYIEDKYCGFAFTSYAYKDLFNLLQYVQNLENYRESYKQLPLYFISGSMDPVGDFAKGVSKIYQELKGIGYEDVDMHIYMGARHELLNETNKYEVYEDILKFIKKHIAG